MKVQWGLMVVAGSGKLGGHVAAKNRAGSYFRTKVTPSNPQTVDQTTVRNNMTANSQAWKGLLPTERLAWNNAVHNFLGTDIFGNSKTPSGFQLYVGTNNNLRFTNETVITSPPLPTSIPAFLTLSAAISEGGDSMDLTFTDPIAVTEKVIISATPPQSAGKSFVKSEYRKVKIATSADTSVLDIMTEYKAKFGATPAEGTKIFIKMQQINIATGLAGAVISTSSIVVA